MEYYVKSVVPIIESNYDNFTTVERILWTTSSKTTRRWTFRQRLWQKDCSCLRHPYPDLPRNADTEATGSSYISMRRPL